MKPLSKNGFSEANWSNSRIQCYEGHGVLEFKIVENQMVVKEKDVQEFFLETSWPI